MGGLLVVVGLMEGMLRGFDDFGYNGPVQINVTTELPNAKATHGRPWYKREFFNVVRFNDAGYHTDSFEADPTKPLRVAVIGDSYVEAKQVPIEQNFVKLTEQDLDGVQLLALGSSAQYAPRQVDLFRQIPELFGENGRYPDVDAVVFCMRLNGMRNVAMGHVEYPVSTYPLPWQYRLKKRIQRPMVQAARRALRAPLHSISYLSSRANDMLAMDLNHAIPPIDAERMAFAHRVMREEVFGEISSLADERGIPVGFVYLPRVNEYENRTSPIEEELREAVLNMFVESGRPFENALSGLPPGEPLFFPYDRHLTPLGHEAFGQALYRVLGQMGFAQP